MINQSTTNDKLSKGATMTDLTFTYGTFTSTTCEVVANTNAGKAFTAETFGSFAAVGAILPKTKGSDLMTFAERKGLEVEWLSE